MTTNAHPEPPVEQTAPMFDLPEQGGLNDSERILSALCRKSFLRLWSQTNVFTDEGFRNGKGSTRELCDALVIFGRDVIVFSDKHVTFHIEKDVSIAWPRWFKRAILDSCKQLHGAKSWLERFPSRVFLDPKCTRPLPVAVPRQGAMRFHLIAVTRGSREPAHAFHEGVGLGSLALNNAIEGDKHFQTPFTVGLPEPDKHFVHVIDEVSIELLLGELNTAPDLLDYLRKREELLGRRGTQVMAFGEEELLALYLRTMNRDGTEHVFFDIPADENLPDVVLVDQGHYSALRDDPGYKRKTDADAISYEWDKLINRFLEYGAPRFHEAYIDQSAAETELALRLMAAESRFRRRTLANSFVGVLQRAGPGERIARLAYGGIAGETVYVFLVAPKRDEDSYDQYRAHRIALLHAYVRTAKLKAPLGTTFVGIAFDNPQKSYQGGSEDLFVLIQEAWTPEELDALEIKRRELRLWGNAMEFWRVRQDEFPQANQRIPLVRIPSGAAEPPASNASTHPRTRKPNDSTKRLKKIQKRSRKRNRRKS